MTESPEAMVGRIRPQPRERGLTRKQLERLREAIPEAFVDRKQGLAYVAQHEVRAELTRIFGWGGWDSQVEQMDLLWEYEVHPGTGHPDYPKEKGGAEKSGGKVYYRACYKARVRLTIRDYWGNVVCSFVEEHVEANSVLPDRGEAHAMAVTSVESYALRRAAIGLGDRFGLGLYDGGKTDPLVKGSLQLTDPESPWFIPRDPQKDAESQARMQQALNTEN